MSQQVGNSLRQQVDQARPTSVPFLVVATVYVMALGGRYTAERLGWTGLGALDLRLPGAVLAILVMAAWWWSPLTRRRPAVIGAPFLWMAALLAWLAVSALWAPVGARVGPRLVDLVVLLALGLGVAVLRGIDTDATARALLWCGYGGGLLYAVAGIVLGETNVQGRMTAFGGGPNVFARVVGIGVIAAIVLHALTRRRALLLAVPVLSVALLLSGSRGAVVSGAGTALAFVLLFPRRCNGRGLVLLITLASLIALTIATFFPTVVGLVRERLALTLAGDGSGRGLLIEQAWGLILEHPFFGVGLDGYWATFGRSIELDYPHNLVLEIGATGGAVALVLVAGFFVSVGNGVRPRADLSVERTGVVVLAIFMFVASLFSGDLYDSRFFWLFAIAAASTSRGRSSSVLLRGSGTNVRPDDSRARAARRSASKRRAAPINGAAHPATTSAVTPSRSTTPTSPDAEDRAGASSLSFTPVRRSGDSAPTAPDAVSDSHGCD